METNWFLSWTRWIQLTASQSKSMGQSPWEANSHPVSQKISRLLCNPNVHYLVHHFHALRTYFPRIHFNIIFPSAPTSSEWSLTCRFSCISQLFHAFYMPHPSHILDIITLIIFVAAYKLRSSSFCSLLQSPATSSLSGPYIFLSTLFSNTLILCSSLSGRD